MLASPPALRVRPLLWAVALEAALVASLLTALGVRSWLVWPLTVLQLPGWVVAAAGLWPFGLGTGRPNAVFTSMMSLVNAGAIYAVLPASEASQTRSR